MRSLPSRPGLLLAWAGVGIEVFGYVWDQHWHAVHGLNLEHGFDIVRAHGFIYAGGVGLTIGLLVNWLSHPSSRLACMGALAGLIHFGGAMWDAWNHIHGRDPNWPHAALFTGLGVAIVALIIATTTQSKTGPGRSSRSP